MSISTERAGGAVPYVNMRSTIKESASRPSNWHPIWLGKPLLSMFVLLFVLLAAALILVNQLIAHHNGFSLALTKNHYVWTYGPTAILVVVVALWRRVQYCAIINQPWQEMSKGPQSAARTVLLDYLSPLQIQSLVRALRNRHFAVAASFSVFALLKLIIVLSTTMFLPQDNVSTQQINVTHETRFGVDEASTFLTQPTDLSENPWVFGSTYSISTEPAWSFWDLRNKYANAEVPIELSTAFTNFSVISDIPDNSLSVRSEVEVFQPVITCEPATLDVLRAHRVDDFFEAKLGSPCPTPNIQISPEPNRIDNTDENVTFAIFLSNCSVDKPTSNWSQLDSTTPDTHQYVIMAMKWAAKNELLPNNTIETTIDTIREIAATSCRLTYSVRPANATVSPSNPGHVQSLEANEESKGKRIANLSNLQLSEALFSSMGLDELFTGYSAGLGYTAGSNLLGFMVNSTWAGSLESLTNTTVLQRAAEEVLTGVFHQLVRQYLLLPDKNVASGSVELRDTRLHCRPVVMWAMTSLLIVASCLVFVVLSFIRSGVAPQSPATLASMVSTLSRSPAMSRCLPRTRNTFISQVHHELGPYQFFTTQSHNGLIKIEMVDDPDTMKPKPKTSDGDRPMNPNLREMKPWSPYPSRRHMVIFTIALPVLSIITLEILWHKIQHGAIETPSSEWSVAAYAIRYGSTAVALLTATLFNSLDFSIASMTVFSRLASKPTTAKRSLCLNILEELPPVALYKAIRYGHFSPAFSLLAVAMGSTLTIISSGLWFMDASISTSLSATAKAQSGWLINKHDISRAAFETVEQKFHFKTHGTAEPSPLIWDTNLVLPIVQTVDIPQSSVQIEPSKPQHYDFTLRAIQPSIECYDSPQDTVTLKKNHMKPLGPHHGIFYLPDGSTSSPRVAIDMMSELNIGSPAGCQSPPGIDSRNLQYGIPAVALRNKEDVFRGASSDVFHLDLLPSTMFDRSAGGLDGTPGCPSFAVVRYNVTAHWDPHNENQMISRLEAAAIVCTQRLRSVKTVVTYTNDNEPLSLQQGPGKVKNVRYPASNDLLSSTTSLMRSNETGLLSFSFDVADILREFVGLNGPYFGFTRGKAPPTNEFINATERAYRFIMTNILDSDFRPRSNENTTYEEEIQGELRGFTSRLRMSKISKITLQVVLGAMAALGALAHQLMDTRGILLENPLSTASSMSLFAGSRLVSLLQESVREDSNDVQFDASDDEQGRQTREAGVTVRSSGRDRKPGVAVMRGRLFRLGWWEETENKNNKPDASSNDGGNDTGNATSSSDYNQLISAREEDEETFNLGGKRFGIDLYEPSSDEDI